MEHVNNSSRDDLELLVSVGKSSKGLTSNCQKLLACLRQISLLLKDCDSNSEDALYLLEDVFKEAKFLMDTSSSKIYRVWHCQQLVRKFEDVTSEIEQVHSQLLLTGAHTKVALKQKRTQYFVDISDERLAEEIEALLVEHRNEHDIELARLQKLAAKIDIRCNKTLETELEALEKQEAHATSIQEKKQINDLLSLFSRLRVGSDVWGVNVPADFRCPLSLELMVDPVIVASGQTYERAYIRKWLNQGHNTCPKTRQVLSHDNLIPNDTVKALIKYWCEANNIPPPGSDEADEVGSTKVWPSDKKQQVEVQTTTTTTTMTVCSSSFHRSISQERSERQKTSLRRSQTIPAQHYTRRELTRPTSDVNRDFLRHIPASIVRLADELQSTSADTRKNAAAELRLLAKDDVQNRIWIAAAGAIKPLTALLEDADSETQESAVTALLNLSINDSNKFEIGKAGAIDPLVKVLKLGTQMAKENAAATLFILSVVEDNKATIGLAGAISPLVDLLATGTVRGKKDAATALFNLSILHENKPRIVRAGAVRSLVLLMVDPSTTGMVDKAVAILANLATIPEGRVAIGEAGGISSLVEVVEMGSPWGKENAAAALLHLCTNSSRHRAMVLQEGAIPPLHDLSHTGTPRAKEKALALLRHFREQRHAYMSI